MNEPELTHLADHGLLNPVLAELLYASVQAGMNLLIAGPPDSGRTTLLGALGRAVPAHQRIATLEPVPQLNLLGPGRQVIELTGPNATDLIPLAMRHSVHRVLIDAPDGDAAVLLQALSAASGSMFTLTAGHPRDALNQLVAQAAVLYDTRAAAGLVGWAVDLFVQLDSHVTAGGHRRFVSHLYEAHPDENGVALREVFAPVPGQPRAVFRNLPARINELEHAGFNRAWLTDATRTWGPW
ncbi:ATPase, T2SS/T4P/T4SS family [Streptomyces formicae]|nr:ATPase, T2SS/T4P/T4SS family [Streptomyces formicae]